MRLKSQQEPRPVGYPASRFSTWPKILGSPGQNKFNHLQSEGDTEQQLLTGEDSDYLAG